ncbi:hypothetical protein Poli38472_000721 [Pythium oligandrum]|uniref:Glucokinase n=1 Tax=Pythium oligandrum TaxID=41045 RepID=A0A8K1CCT3_PYTOL|nr:hypothetical protein Poli38472_000721 [Pythium oligandrum]|eukprot:TMW60679.1 hypothetical protein Poli38472_000721 [Pythium oligandrum]
MASRVFVGVDIGGSSVKVGLVTDDGRVLGRQQTAIDPDDQAPERVVEHAHDLLEIILAETQTERTSLVAVGVASPGQLVDGGVIHAAANFPDWKDVPLRQLFITRLGKEEVVMCNDADAAILAEKWIGSAKGGIKNFIMLTLGTGVGCGLVVDGQLVRGGSNFIEGGHMIVERNGRLCGCTQRGCLEAYSSATALVVEAQEHLTAGADSILSKYPIDEINAKLIFEVAAKGDAMSIRLIEEAADYLGFACVSLCRILDPEMIVLSGGMAEAGEMFIQLVRASYLKYSWTKFPNPVIIEKASAGYDSGILGAAAVACSFLV